MGLFGPDICEDPIPTAESLNCTGGLGYDAK